jgi:small GTP-binding protein
MGGLFSSISAWISGKQEVRVLILGLDFAGKTTILYRLSLNQAVTQVAPTVAFNLENVEVGKLRLQIWDLGGQNQLRPFWRLYFKDTTGVVFVVDSTDRQRIGLCAEELGHLLREEELRGIPLVVLANKQDINDAMTPEELSQKMALPAIQDRPWTIMATSALQGTGIKEAFDWLADNIEAKNK